MGLKPVAVTKAWARGTLYAENGLYKAHWGYHTVCAYLCVDNSTGQLKTMVVTPDPALTKVEPGGPLEPMVMPFEDWVNAINQSGAKVEIFLSPPQQFWPPWTQDQTSLSWEASLPQARQINDGYFQTQETAIAKLGTGTTTTPPAVAMSAVVAPHVLADGTATGHVTLTHPNGMPMALLPKATDAHIADLNTEVPMAFVVNHKSEITSVLGNAT
jgi:hypothetical protein